MLCTHFDSSPLWVKLPFWSQEGSGSLIGRILAPLLGIPIMQWFCS